MIRFGVCSLLCLLGGFAYAQDTIFRATSAGLDVPTSLPAGFHEVVLETDNEKGYTFSLFQLKPGVTLAAVKAAYEAINKAYMTGGNPAAAMRKMVSLGDIVLDIDRQAGGAQKVYGLSLEPGPYAAYSAPYTDEGYGDYVYKGLEVRPTPQPVAAPVPDATVRLVDFAFMFPARLHAGPQTWQIVNGGKQVHHLVLVKLKEGVSREAGERYAMTQEGEDPADYAQSHFLGALAPGRSVYMDIDLVPGSYLVVCHIPDYSTHGDGKPHLMHGMMQSFVVNEPIPSE